MLLQFNNRCGQGWGKVVIVIFWHSGWFQVYASHASQPHHDMVRVR